MKHFVLAVGVLALLLPATATAGGAQRPTTNGDRCGPGDSRDFVCRRSGRVTTLPPDVSQTTTIRTKKARELKPKTTVRVTRTKRQTGTALLAFGNQARCTAGNTVAPTELMTRWDETTLFKLSSGKSYCKIGRDPKTAEFLCDDDLEDCNVVVRAKRARASFRASHRGLIPSTFASRLGSPAFFSQAPSRTVKITVCAGSVHVAVKGPGGEGEVGHFTSYPTRVMITITETFYESTTQTVGNGFTQVVSKQESSISVEVTNEIDQGQCV